MDIPFPTALIGEGHHVVKSIQQHSEKKMVNSVLQIADVQASRKAVVVFINHAKLALFGEAIWIGLESIFLSMPLRTINGSTCGWCWLNDHTIMMRSLDCWIGQFIKRWITL